MKKIFAALMSLTMLLSFTACGDDKSDGTVSYHSQAETEQAEETRQSGEGGVYNAGKITAVVPRNWFVYPVYDRLNGGGEKETGLKIGKGAVEEKDLDTRPYIQLDIYPAGEEFSVPTAGMYIDGEGNPVAPITAGDYTWNGFDIMFDVDLKLIVLYTEDKAGNHYVAHIWPELVGGSISLTDSDVLEILAGVKAS